MSLYWPCLENKCLWPLYVALNWWPLYVALNWWPLYVALNWWPLYVALNWWYLTILVFAINGSTSSVSFISREYKRRGGQVRPHIRKLQTRYKQQQLQHQMQVQQQQQGYAYHEEHCQTRDSFFFLSLKIIYLKSSYISVSGLILQLSCLQHASARCTNNNNTIIFLNNSFAVHKQTYTVVSV